MKRVDIFFWVAFIIVEVAGLVYSAVLAVGDDVPRASMYLILAAYMRIRAEAIKHE